MDAYTSLLIFTDLEPDDLCALTILFKQPKLPSVIDIIVGEGKCDKTRLAQTLATVMSRPNVHIAESRRSDKDYPAALLACLDNTSKTRLSSPFILDDASLLIRESLATKNPLVLALKPVTELYAWPRAELAHATLAMYGSFNFRATFGDEHRPADVETWLNTSFKCVYVYESFLATGAQSSVNAENAPALFACIAERYPFLTRAMRAWNSHIVLDCTETVDAAVKKLQDTIEFDMRVINSIERNNKIIGAVVRGGVDTQMVLADMALVAALLAPARIPWTRVGHFHFNDAGYTTLGNESRGVGELWTVRGVAFDQVVATVASLM